jgi:hypothetical protein
MLTDLSAGCKIKDQDIVCCVKNNATLVGSLFTMHVTQVHIDLPTLSDTDKHVSNYKHGDYCVSCQYSYYAFRHKVHGEN